MIISDFEPISAWACKLYGKECVGLSNQFAMISPETPKLSNFNFLHRLFLKYFCPVSIGYGIHYQSLGKKIFSPIIKKRLFKIRPEKLSHYTVYLPSYSVKKITQKLKGIKNMNFHVFTKEVSRSKTDKNFIFKISENIESKLPKEIRIEDEKGEYKHLVIFKDNKSPLLVCIKLCNSSIIIHFMSEKYISASL